MSKMKIEASSGGKVVFINKLIINEGEAKYTPSIKQVVSQLLGLGDYKKDVRNVLDNMGMKHVEYNDKN